MMNVLDALRYRLGAVPPSNEQIDPRLLEALGMQRGARQQMPLPSGLPLGVQDQIRNQPSYGEGEVMPKPNPLMEQEHTAGAFFGPRRENALRQSLGDVSRLRQEEIPLHEGEWLTTRPPGQSPFASPLNQFMQLGRQTPLAMY